MACYEGKLGFYYSLFNTVFIVFKKMTDNGVTVTLHGGINLNFSNRDIFRGFLQSNGSKKRPMGA